MTDEKLHDLMVDIRDSDLDKDQTEVPFSPVPRGLSDKQPGRGKTLPLIIGGAVFGTAILAGAGFWIYSLGVESGKSRVPPMIRASVEPEKVKPEEPGGDQIPHQDKQLFGMIEKAGKPDAVEPAKELKLSAEPEQPVARKLETETVPESTETDLPPVNTAPAGDVETSPLDDPQKAKTEKAEIENAKSLMEKTPEDLMKLAEVAKDASVPPVAETQMPEAAAPVNGQPDMSDKPASLKKPEPSPEVETVIVQAEPPKKEIVVLTEPKTPQKAVSEKKDETVIVSSAGAVSPGGPFLVQLASFKSEASASKSWNRLSMKHKLILTGAEMNVQSVTIKDKGTWYRLRADGFNSRGDALRFCNQLKEQKQDCLVVKR